MDQQVAVRGGLFIVGASALAVSALHFSTLHTLGLAALLAVMAGGAAVSGESSTAGRGDGLFRRRLHVFSVATRVFADYKLTQRRDKRVRDPAKNNELWEKAHERNAERVFKAICRLEGLWVKAGQYLSTRADVLPEAYIRRLRLLQDTLPPRPIAEVRSTIKAEMGEDVSTLFEHFDPEPLATASIAQVHRARMKDGKEVVVKVQHAGVKERILQDLGNLRSIVEWVAWSEPQYNFGPLVDEWCNEVPKELDFNTEAENTRRVAANLTSATASDPAKLTKVDVLLPTVIESRERVLVMEYMEGVRLNDIAALDAMGVNKQRLVETITRAYAHQIYIDGFFNADPHPGNFLVSKEAPHKPILLDFGLTKNLNPTIKRALAKMLLSAAELDLASLLSAFEEMGLKLNRDMPEDAMRITSYFFRKASPPQEAKAELAAWRKEHEERLKRNEGEEDESLRRNPVDAFPSDAVFFMRVLNLLRGLSSSMDARIAYLEEMRPFAETALSSEGAVALPGPAVAEPPPLVLDSPVRSPADARVRELIADLIRQGKVLGMQVCAYKGGKPVVDCAAGVLGRFDPRPVQLDSLFSSFSTTKGVTAALAHWLADRGQLDFAAKVKDLWPEFGVNGKEDCTVAHVFTHRAGLQNAATRELMSSPFSLCQWEAMLRRMEEEKPEDPPGTKEVYHYLSFGWLAGGIIERAAGKPFAAVLEEALTQPLDLEGEFYVGLPPGVESRVATLAVDATGLDTVASRLPARNEGPVGNSASAAPGATQDALASAMEAPSSTGREPAAEAAKSLSGVPLIFNALQVRRACIPSANGHFSARALARFYAALAAGGLVPEPDPNWAKALPPKLGVSESKEQKATGWKKLLKKRRGKGDRQAVVAATAVEQVKPERLFEKPDVLDAMRGVGEYRHLTAPGGRFGLGFGRFGNVEEGEKVPFGHSGMGGSVAFCIPEHDFSIAVTLNKLSVSGEVTAAVVRLVCQEVGVPVPANYKEPGDGPI